MVRINETLFSNYDYNVEDYKEYHKEFCEYMEQDYIEEDFQSWLGDTLQTEWEDFQLNLEYSKFNTKCVILGSVGLWNGVKEIVPTLCDNLSDAIRKCLGSCDYITVKRVNGHLEVTSIHHDGRNNFEIHLLSDKGLNSGDNADLNKRVYHKAINERYLF